MPCPKPTKISEISETIGKSGQKVVFTEVLKLPGEKSPGKIRIVIASDPYQFQCYAHVDVWKDEKWSEVHKITPSNMKTKGSLYVWADHEIVASLFLEDRDELLRVAALVLYDEEPKSLKDWMRHRPSTKKFAVHP